MDETADLSARLDMLTPRERVVFRLAGLGMTMREIAAHLSLNVRAVKFHLGHIYDRLGLAEWPQPARGRELRRCGEALAMQERNDLSAGTGA